MREYAWQGILPEALVNFFALMGWYPRTAASCSRCPSCVERFRIEEMGKSGAVFDTQKLMWMNGVYMQQAYRQNPDRVVSLVVDYLRRVDVLHAPVVSEQRAYVARVVAIMGERFRVPADVLAYGDFFFRDEIEYDPAAVQRYLEPAGALEIFGPPARRSPTRRPSILVRSRPRCEGRRRVSA